MITHVVLFKLKDYKKEEKKEILSNLKSSLEALTGKIKELKQMEVGLNYELESKSYDLCLITRFETLADLDSYRIHPEHMKVFGLLQASAETRAAVDYYG